MALTELRPGSIVFGLAVGLAVAWWSYVQFADPAKLDERREQERVVLLARQHLIAKIGLADAEIVDPLAPQRKVGKVYIYPSADGWEVSGFYRRDDSDRWHAFLMSIDGSDALRHLKVQDRNDALAVRSMSDPVLEVLP